jgi:hypothetical protein
MRCLRKLPGRRGRGGREDKDIRTSEYPWEADQDIRISDACPEGSGGEFRIPEYQVREWKIAALVENPIVGGKPSLPTGFWIMLP